MKKNVWLVLLIVIVIISIKYYSDYSVNRDKREESNRTAQQVLQNQKSCAEDGQKYFQRRVDEGKKGGIVFEDKGEYIFNSKMNTCLYMGNYYTSSDKVLKSGAYVRYITDIYTNKNLVFWSRDVVSGKDITGSADEFNQGELSLGFTDWRIK